MNSIKMILSGLALSTLAAPISADLSTDLPGCRSLDDLGKKTVVQFESAYRLMDFCTDQSVERMLMSNPDHWQVIQSTPPNIEGVRGFFTVQPKVDANDPEANNVIIYLEDGTRRELWLQVIERENLSKEFGRAFIEAYELGVKSEISKSDKMKKGIILDARKNRIAESISEKIKIEENL